jgi:NADH dehydrogenase [ubiquinone] 1 alpha subcomplex assembly factor 5
LIFNGPFNFYVAANRLVDRLDDITRKFPLALDIGCHRGHIYNAIDQQEGIGGVESLVQCDISASVIDAAKKYNAGKRLHTSYTVVDEEDMPFEANQFDLVISSLNLHWVNDLPKVLTKIKTILKPDGCFLGSMIGGSSLAELRQCFYLAELERKGGISPHTSPFVQSSDMAGLLQSAGFALPTVDIDTITVKYNIY